MCKLNKKSGKWRIDPCLKTLINNLKEFIGDDGDILACCCGHAKYGISIIVKYANGYIFDICSDVCIPRQKRFYKKDKQGYYYIPEVSGEVMSKVSSEDEEIWYCKKCDNEYRINQDGSRDVIS